MSSGSEQYAGVNKGKSGRKAGTGKKSPAKKRNGFKLKDKTDSDPF